MKKQIFAYLLVAAIAAWSAFQADKAVDLAREVDHRGDTRSCQQENRIRQEANERNAALAKTARLVVKSLDTISKADRPAGDPTNARLQKQAKVADRVEKKFRNAAITDCAKVFPKP